MECRIPYFKKTIDIEENLCYSVVEKDELKIGFFRYCGEYYDREIEQIYLRARYYDPSLGRFTQQDPAMADGNNWYVYCGNNPVINVDPSGLDHYIFYGDSQARDALTYEEQLNEKYPDTNVHLISVTSAEEFAEEWEKMGNNGEDIECVVVALHGSPYSITADPGNEAGKIDVRKLAYKTIDTIVLTSCNTGNVDYVGNIATQFVRGQDVNQVVAPDGWTIVKKVDRGMRKIGKAQPRHAGRTKVQPD